ncbi:MAG: hypothetical protein WD733_01230 [Bryobacterales bacterium]
MARRLSPVAGYHPPGPSVIPMDADKPRFPDHRQEPGQPALAQAAAIPPSEPWTPQYPTASRPAVSLLGATKFFVILAIAGWFAFLYFSEANIPVSDYRLGLMLPETPEGWRRSFTRSGNPSSVSIGTGLTFEKFTSSNAWRTYSQGGKQVTVEIWDWAGDYPYHIPLDIPGWANGALVRVGAEEGRLRYNPETRTGRLRVRYLDRFYLVVEGDGIERHELLAWYQRIDLGGLRAELDRLQRTAASR